MKNTEKSETDKRVRRIPYRVRVVMHPRDSGEHHEGEACDLSMGGMFIETILPLEPGTVFDIEIPMQPLSYRGAVRVLRTRLHEEGTGEPAGLAVEWVDMSTHQKRVLFRQIEDHIQRGGELLSGNPDAAVESRPADRGIQAASEVAAPGHTQLIIRLSIAVVLVLITLVLLLQPWP